MYLAYNQLSSLTPANSSNTTKNSTTKRALLSLSTALSIPTNGILPLVFYGTALALVFKFLCNFIFCLFFLMILRKDPGY